MTFQDVGLHFSEREFSKIPEREKKQVLAKCPKRGRFDRLL